MRRSSIYLATFVLLAASAFAQSYKLLQPIPLGGDGAWAYLQADVEARRLYISHSGEVVVIDLDTQKRFDRLAALADLASNNAECIGPIPGPI